MYILENDTPMPSIMGHDLDGKPADMVESVAGSWGAILVYRGHW